MAEDDHALYWLPAYHLAPLSRPTLRWRCTALQLFSPPRFGGVAAGSLSPLILSLHAFYRARAFAVWRQPACNAGHLAARRTARTSRAQHLLAAWHLARHPYAARGARDGRLLPPIPAWLAGCDRGQDSIHPCCVLRRACSTKALQQPSCVFWRRASARPHQRQQAMTATGSSRAWDVMIQVDMFIGGRVAGATTLHPHYLPSHTLPWLHKRNRSWHRAAARAHSP